MNSNTKVIQKQKRIDPNKHYLFPDEISIIRHKDHILVISVNTANWIILDNDDQLLFFNLLKRHKLSEALEVFTGNISDAQKVVIQLEARDFENQDVMLKCADANMHIHLTNICNMRCPHCYMFAGTKNQNEMTTEEVFTLLRSLKECGGTLVTFTGGEVCTRIDLYEIVKFAYDLGLKTELLTNGTLWTDELIDNISPLISRVQISIDGFSEEKNAKIRGKGNFKKALETVDKFVKHNVYTDVAVTPFFDDSLEREYKEYAEFGKQLLDKYAEYEFNVKFCNEILDGRDIKFDEEQRQKFITIMDKINFACFGDIYDTPFINFHKRKGIEENCNYGNITVTSDGDLYFCPQIPTLKPFANIRKDSIEHIMNLSQQAKERSNVNNVMPCKDCELKYICGGDCRIKYFKEFVDCNVCELSTYPVRKCDRQTKELFYDLMIRTNHRIFQ